MRNTAAATYSLSCGTKDRDCNEVVYLQETLDLEFLRRDTHHDDFELVSTERSFPMRPKVAKLNELEVQSLRCQDEVNSGAKWQGVDGKSSASEEMLSGW